MRKSEVSKLPKDPARKREAGSKHTSAGRLLYFLPSTLSTFFFED
jgi:hypothetical protein